MTQCARNVVEVLIARNFSKTVTVDKLLKDPSCRDFFDIFKFLVSQFDPNLKVEGRMEDEVPQIMRRMNYPVEVNRSKLQAISGPNTWPQLLAVLDWLAVLVRISETLLVPLAECQASLADVDGGDEGNHILLQTLHENYVNFIYGREEKEDEEKLKQIYQERNESIRGEIGRLADHCESMEKRIAALQSEHERLLDLQKTPANLEREADSLRNDILSSDARVQRIEAETEATQADEREWAFEDQELREQVRTLAEQVQNQAYSKKDVERLKFRRSRLSEVVRELATDSEAIEQDVWDLKQGESRRSETIGRQIRQVNEVVESLSGAFQDAGINDDMTLRVDLGEPNDTLAAQDFADFLNLAQIASTAHLEETQQTETELVGVQNETRSWEEQRSNIGREYRHLRERLDYLSQRRKEFNQWSAEQLDEAQKTAEATEDAVHAITVGTAAPTIRDSAEIDKLKLALTAIKTQGANELAQMREQIMRDEQRFEDHRRNVLKQFDGHMKDVEEFLTDFEGKVEDNQTLNAFRRTSKLNRGGC